MTETGGHTLYAPRPHPVQMAAAFAMALALPASAQVDDTFAQFQARCLTPMAEVRESDTDGLQLLASDIDSERYIADFRDWQLERSTQGAVIRFCAIYGSFGDEVADWVAEALASERYIPIPRDGSDAQTLQSTTWREPRIEVEIDRTAIPMRLTVIETDLES